MAKSKVGGRRVAARQDGHAKEAAAEEKPLSIRPPAVIAMLILAAGGAALAIFQWSELLHIQSGGSTFCSIDGTFDCVSVWESGFAKSIHRFTRLPIAGWGLVWALTALAAGGLILFRSKKKKPVRREVAAARLIAAAGIAVSIVLLGVTLKLGVYCLTCFGTYALVIAFSLFAWKVAPPSARGDWNGGLSLAAVLTAGGYLLLLYPGTNTPVEVSRLGKPKVDGPAQAVREQPKSTGDLLADFLIQLAPLTQQAIADALADYREAPVRVRDAYPPRRVLGSPSAPVAILEWSDIRCGHCKTFSETLEEIGNSSPPGAFSVELRQFPLDGSCNPHVQKEMVDPTGVRCLAAKSLLCIEGLPGFRAAQEKMFAAQSNLTAETDLAIATGAGMPRDALTQCLASPDTAAKLKADADFAMVYGLHGTPLVVVNGREASAFGPFLYALVIAGGDDKAGGWGVLPKPRADRHEGHQH